MVDFLRGPLAVLAAAFIGAAAATTLVLWWGGLASLPSPQAGAYCNVLKVPVYGEIVTIRPPTSLEGATEGDDPNTSPPLEAAYAVSTEIEDSLRAAARDPNIKALLVDIESGGGGPVAGVEIASAIKRFGRPSAAVIHEIGASSGYLVAAAADTVFAADESQIGSIGVTSSFADQSKKDEKEGLTFHQLSSGPFKDMFNLAKPLTEAERALIMRDIQISHDNFVRQVAVYRNQPVEKIAALADGSTLMGKAALEAGLIDAIGGTDEALQYLEQAIGEPVALCW